MTLEEGLMVFVGDPLRDLLISVITLILMKSQFANPFQVPYFMMWHPHSQCRNHWIQGSQVPTNGKKTSISRSWDSKASVYSVTPYSCEWNPDLLLLASVIFGSVLQAAFDVTWREGRLRYRRLQIPKGFPRKEVPCNTSEKSVNIQTSLQKQHSETAIKVTGFGSIWILANSSDLASRSCKRVKIAFGTNLGTP